MSAQFVTELTILMLAIFLGRGLEGADAPAHATHIGHNAIHGIVIVERSSWDAAPRLVP